MKKVISHNVKVEYEMLVMIERALALACGMDVLTQGGVIRLGGVIAKRGAMERTYPDLINIRLGCPL